MVIALNDTQSCASFLQQAILNGLRHWQNFPALNTVDVTALDREREGIIRTVSLAFDLEEAWEPLHNLIVKLTPYMERRGHWESWRWFLNRAIDAARRVEDISSAVELSLLLARVTQHQDQGAATIAAYRQTMRLADQINDAYNKARACSNLGYLYVERGYWWRAEILCCHALATFKRLTSDHGQAHTENHLGVLYTRQRRWEKARQHLDRACAIWEKMEDNHGLMRGLINLGMLCNDMRHLNEALEYLTRSLEQAEVTGEAADIGTIYMNIATAYRLKQEPEKAKNYILKAETIFNRFSNLAGLAWMQSTLGLIYLDQGKWSDAKHYLESSLQAWRSLNNINWQIISLTFLVDYDAARKNWSRAKSRLAEIEQLIAKSGEDAHSPAWASLLKKYQYILAENKKPL